MRRLRIALVIFFSLVVVFGLFFFLLGYLKPKAAGVYIETSPNATVYVDGVQVGRTPYKNTQNPGEIVVKLVPESFSTPLAPYETRLTLVSGVETVIRRDFAQDQEGGSGEIVSFEKLGGKGVGLAIVTQPNSAQISIDGAARGYAPFKTSDISVGEHELKVAAQSFSEKTLKVRLQEGYQLTALVDLAPNGETMQEEETEVVSEEEPQQQFVRILPTPVGFLRVRKRPSTLEEEVGQVEPEEEYKLLEEDADTGWYRIEFEDADTSATASGWISNQYAEKVESTP